MKKFTEIVSKAMAKSLSLDENCFLNQFGERETLQARFNYYSCTQRPDLVLGLKPHADGSGYTIILQDDVEGLQILKDEQWFTVPTISDALLVLMADQMEVSHIICFYLLFVPKLLFLQLDCCFCRSNLQHPLDTVEAIKTSLVIYN